MLIPFIIFVAVTVTIVGGYFAAAQLPGILAERRLDRRLRDVSTDSAAADPNAPAGETVLQRALEGPLPGMDRLVSGSGAGKRITRLIEQSGVRTTPSALVLMSLVAAAIAGFLMFLFVPQRFAPLAAAAHRRAGAASRRGASHSASCSKTRASGLRCAICTNRS